MKSNKKSKSIIEIFGICLIALSSIITNSACLGLFGEITPPKSLMDK